MKQIGIFFGSSTGDTEKVALLIQELIGIEKADIHDIKESKAEDLRQYSFLIMGISTWGTGNLQEDWEEFLRKLSKFNYSGYKAALFGLGDQESYPDTFADAMGFVYDTFKSLGFNMTGEFPVNGYEFLHSRAERNGEFVGLVIDERNQPGLTEGRVIAWLKNLGLL